MDTVTKSQLLDWTKATVEQIQDYELQQRETYQKKVQQERQGLAKLEQIVLQSINALNSAENNLRAGNEQCGTPLLTNINSYLKSLSSMAELSSELGEFEFGVGVCEYIDEGRNPQEMMQRHFEFTKQRNNQTRARLVATNHLEQHLKNGQQHLKKFQSKFNSTKQN